MSNLKDWIITAIGAVGGFIASLMGGWDAAVITLVIFMCVDYISGIVVAAVFHKSNKTESGVLQSKAGWKGIVRKVFTLILVLVAAQLDKLIGTNFVRDAVVIAFCANEAISIVENAGAMGIPIPTAIKKAIDVLQDKADKGGEE